jgi:hypothetical protein
MVGKGLKTAVIITMIASLSVYAEIYLPEQSNRVKINRGATPWKFIRSDPLGVQVYINETLIKGNSTDNPCATHVVGFLPFIVDLTRFVKFGGTDNVLAVRVGNSFQTEDWHPIQLTGSTNTDNSLVNGIYFIRFAVNGKIHCVKRILLVH